MGSINYHHSIGVDRADFFDQFNLSCRQVCSFTVDAFQARVRCFAHDQYDTFNTFG
ncbi:hypothetical protein D3C75_1287140 [compost metagenome]